MTQLPFLRCWLGYCSLISYRAGDTTKPCVFTTSNASAYLLCDPGLPLSFSDRIDLLDEVLDPLTSFSDTRMKLFVLASFLEQLVGDVQGGPNCLAVRVASSRGPDLVKTLLHEGSQLIEVSLFGISTKRDRLAVDGYFYRAFHLSS